MGVFLSRAPKVVSEYEVREMRDSDIRLALDKLLRKRHANEPDTIIRHEVGLCAGKRRIDIAIINSEIIGYEIKSDEDTLNRLEGQAEAYGHVLDKAILVTTERHLDSAVNKLPDWWGVIVAHEKNGGIYLDNFREPAVNDQQDDFALAQLLWREEALEELHLRDKGQGLSKKARYYVWIALANAVSLDDLRSIVRARLKARPAWPGGQPHGLCDVTHQTITS